MRTLTDTEIVLCEEIIAKVTDPYIGNTPVDPHIITVLEIELRLECDRRHAEDPSFPPDWHWRVEQYTWKDNEGRVNYTGQIIARPTSIAGEEIRWSVFA